LTPAVALAGVRVTTFQSEADERLGAPGQESNVRRAYAWLEQETVCGPEMTRHTHRLAENQPDTRKILVSRWRGRPASRLVSRWRGRPALMTLGRETCVTITEGDLRHDYIMHNYEEGDLR
jgi:hypothetical protein